MKCLLLEGPFSNHLRGWRHYQIVTRARAAGFVARAGNGPATAAKLGAEFFAAGTWEAEPNQADAAMFPLPRREILAKLAPETQAELAV